MFTLYYSQFHFYWADVSGLYLAYVDILVKYAILEISMIFIGVLISRKVENNYFGKLNRRCIKGRLLSWNFKLKRPRN